MIESSNDFGFSTSRVERDVNTFISGIEKMNQALELLEETIKYEKKKASEKTINPSE